MCSLTKRQDFEMVFKEGITFSSKYLVMYVRPNGLSLNRLGLSVSKKLGKAVLRNRLRRLLREAMRRLLSEGSCGQGFPLNYDFIIIARRSSVEARLDDFIQDIKRFLLRLAHEKSSDITGKAI